MSMLDDPRMTGGQVPQPLGEGMDVPRQGGAKKDAANILASMEQALQQMGMGAGQGGPTPLANTGRDIAEAGRKEAASQPILASPSGENYLGGISYSMAETEKPPVGGPGSEFEFIDRSIDRSRAAMEGLRMGPVASTPPLDSLDEQITDYDRRTTPSPINITEAPYPGPAGFGPHAERPRLVPSPEGQAQVAAARARSAEIDRQIEGIIPTNKLAAKAQATDQARAIEEEARAKRESAYHRIYSQALMDQQSRLGRPMNAIERIKWTEQHLKEAKSWYGAGDDYNNYVNTRIASEELLAREKAAPLISALEEKIKEGDIDPDEAAAEMARLKGSYSIHDAANIRDAADFKRARLAEANRFRFDDPRYKKASHEEWNRGRQLVDNLTKSGSRAISFSSDLTQNKDLELLARSRFLTSGLQPIGHIGTPTDLLSRGFGLGSRDHRGVPLTVTGKPEELRGTSSYRGQEPDYGLQPDIQDIVQKAEHWSKKVNKRPLKEIEKRDLFLGVIMNQLRAITRNSNLKTTDVHYDPILSDWAISFKWFKNNNISDAAKLKELKKLLHEGQGALRQGHNPASQFPDDGRLSEIDKHIRIETNPATSKSVRGTDDVLDALSAFGGYLTRKTRKKIAPATADAFKFGIGSRPGPSEGGFQPYETWYKEKLHDLYGKANRIRQHMGRQYPGGFDRDDYLSSLVGSHDGAPGRSQLPPSLEFIRDQYMDGRGFEATSDIFQIYDKVRMAFRIGTENDEGELVPSWQVADMVTTIEGLAKQQGNPYGINEGVAKSIRELYDEDLRKAKNGEPARERNTSHPLNESDASKPGAPPEGVRPEVAKAIEKTEEELLQQTEIETTTKSIRPATAEETKAAEKVRAAEKARAGAKKPEPERGTLESISASISAQKAGVNELYDRMQGKGKYAKVPDRRAAAVTVAERTKLYTQSALQEQVNATNAVLSEQESLLTLGKMAAEAFTLMGDSMTKTVGGLRDQKGPTMVPTAIAEALAATGAAKSAATMRLSVFGMTGHLFPSGTSVDSMKAQLPLLQHTQDLQQKQEQFLMTMDKDNFNAYLDYVQAQTGQEIDMFKAKDLHAKWTMELGHRKDMDAWEAAKFSFEQQNAAMGEAQLGRLELETIEALKKTIMVGQAVVDQKPLFGTGWFKNYWESLGNYLGWADPDWHSFKQLVTAQLNTYVNELTGKQLSRHEVARLKGVVPQMSDNDAVFERKAKTFVALQKAILRKKLAIYAINGHYVAPQQADMALAWRVRTKDGKVAQRMGTIGKFREYLRTPEGRLAHQQKRITMLDDYQRPIRPGDGDWLGNIVAQGGRGGYINEQGFDPSYGNFYGGQQSVGKYLDRVSRRTDHLAPYGGQLPSTKEGQQALIRELENRYRTTFGTREEFERKQEQVERDTGVSLERALMRGATRGLMKGRGK